MIFFARYVPMDGWLVYLARDWVFANELVAQPMLGHHGCYAVLMRLPDVADV